MHDIYNDIKPITKIKKKWIHIIIFFNNELILLMLLLIIFFIYLIEKIIYKNNFR